MTPKKKPSTPDQQPQSTAPIEEVIQYTVSLTAEAAADLEDISDTATREVILRRASELQNEPLKQGKALTGDLKTYRSVRAAGQRYRLVYQVVVHTGTGQVIVVVIGIRKEGNKRDVYRVASKRLKPE